MKVKKVKKVKKVNKMESGYIYIENNIFSSLFAISQTEQEQGLMRQSWPPPVMSFLYNKPNITKFWMHQTPSPLDIVFTCYGKITQIHKGEPFSTKIIGEDQCSDLIIEFPYGTAINNDFKLGSKVGIITPKSSDLKELFLKKLGYNY